MTRRAFVPIEDGATAQALFGPLHRHFALIQEAFRDPIAPRGAHSPIVDARGTDDRLCACAQPTRKRI